VRIGWKYCLGLDLTDPGFDFSVLSQFRTRLVTHDRQGMAFEILLDRLVELGLVTTRGRQRTDATHVVAAVRDLNRLEMVGETLRAALEALAAAAPQWLTSQIDAEVIKRYGARISPYDIDARHSEKRGTSWDGYKVHVTETCDSTPADDGTTDPGRPPNLITNVVTTHAAVADSAMTMPIRTTLADRDLLPAEHLMDAGYPVDGESAGSADRASGASRRPDARRLFPARPTAPRWAVSTGRNRLRGCRRRRLRWR
jgi:hypothetical protein